MIASNIIEPQNASFEYSEDGYKIVNEIEGNKVKKDALYASIVNAINNAETTINLDENNCYVNPKYTSTSQKLLMLKIFLISM